LKYDADVSSDAGCSHTSLGSKFVGFTVIKYSITLQFWRRRHQMLDTRPYPEYILAFTIQGKSAEPVKKRKRQPSFDYCP